jgi:hypothetical protein
MKTLARRADTDELRRRLQALRPDSVRRWGRMTVDQMVCHVGDAFAMAMGEAAVVETSTVLQRTVVKWIALYAPLAWPPDIRTSRELDQQAGAGTSPAEFAGDLARTIALLERVGAATVLHPRHPIFGPMSPAAWLRWGYLHTDHHLRQFGV